MTKPKTDHGALLPPGLTTSVDDYKAYLVNYKLYQAELSAIKARANQAKKDVRDEQRAASAKGKTLVVKKTVSYRDVVVGSVSVKEPVVTRQTKEISVVRAKGPLSPESKKAKTVAKRRRYKANLKLRKAKKAAELSKWQLVTAKNVERRKKAETAGTQRPKPSVKETSVADKPKGKSAKGKDKVVVATSSPANRPNPPKERKIAGQVGPTSATALQKPPAAASLAASIQTFVRAPLTNEELKALPQAPKRDQYSKPQTSGFSLKNVGSYLGDLAKREKYIVENAHGVLQCHTVIPAVRAAIGGMIKPSEVYPLSEDQWTAIRKYHADNKLPI
jgi:hypothetical protein